MVMLLLVGERINNKPHKKFFGNNGSLQLPVASKGALETKPTYCSVIFCLETKMIYSANGVWRLKVFLSFMCERSK